MKPNNQTHLPTKGDKIVVHELEGDIIGTVVKVKDLSQYGVSGNTITIKVEQSNVTWLGSGKYSFGARSDWGWCIDE